MKQEYKELLLKDLCARLPYGVICDDNRHGSGRVTNIDITPDDIEHKNPKVILYYFDFDECGELENCKPYLRPMSSMTEEEAMEIAILLDIKDILSVKVTSDYIDVIVDDGFCSTAITTIWYDEIISSIQIFDWLNAHHFDYRGLIDKNLALDCTELHIYN